MANVFISYPGPDAVLAEKLAKSLRRAGHKVWFAEWAIAVGDSIPASLNRGLEHANYVVVCLSALGLAPWMSAEVWSAYSRQLNGLSVKLLPVRFRAGEVPALLSDLRYADLSRNWNKGVAALLGAMR
jgi:hypothetical protein